MRSSFYFGPGHRTPNEKLQMVKMQKISCAAVCHGGYFLRFLIISLPTPTLVVAQTFTISTFKLWGKNSRPVFTMWNSFREPSLPYIRRTTQFVLDKHTNSAWRSGCQKTPSGGAIGKPQFFDLRMRIRILWSSPASAGNSCIFSFGILSWCRLFFSLWLKFEYKRSYAQHECTVCIWFTCV